MSICVALWIGFLPLTGLALEAVQIRDVTLGTGLEIKQHSGIKIHYKAFIKDGPEIFSTHKIGLPFPIHMGIGETIAGLEEGLLGMRVGGKRILTIPPRLAYGEHGSLPLVPPNATLVMEVELIEIYSY